MKLTRLLPLLVAYGCICGFGCSKVESAEAPSQVPSEVAKSAAAAGSGESADGGNSGFKPTTIRNISRSVIRTGRLTVRVPSVEKAEDELAKYVSESGGFVGASSSSDLAGDRPQVDMTIRVPSNLFDQALERIEALGTPLSKSVTSEDVTSTVVDYQARLRNMRARVEGYRAQIARGYKTEELSQRVEQLQPELESMEAQLKTLSALTALSTIEVLLVQSAGAMPTDRDPAWAKESWSAATTSAGNVFRSIATGAMWLFAFSPVIVVPSAVAHWLARRASAKRRKATSIDGNAVISPPFAT